MEPLDWIRDNCRFAQAEKDRIDLSPFSPEALQALRRPDINSLRRKISKILWDICSNKYYDAVPLKEIQAGLDPLGIEFDWEEMGGGMILTGEDGHTLIGLKMYGVPMSKTLSLSWHEMQSGRYEINAYLSL